MWSFRSEQLSDGRCMRFAVDLGSQSASFADVVRAWTDDASFRSLFDAQLADTDRTEGSPEHEAGSPGSAWRLSRAKDRHVKRERLPIIEVLP